MFKGREWGYIFGGPAIGAIVGVILSIVTPIYSGCAELYNCTFGAILSCKLPYPDDFSGDDVKYIIIVTTAIGFVIGFFIALSIRNNRVSQENSAQAVKNYKDIVKQINATLDRVKSPENNLKKKIESVSYSEDRLKNQYMDCYNKSLKAQSKAEHYLKEFEVDVTEV